MTIVIPEKKGADSVINAVKVIKSKFAFSVIH